MPVETLTARDLEIRKSALQEKLAVGELIFYVEGNVPGSSTSRMYRGSITMLGGNERINCVLKIPTSDVAGQNFYNLVYRDRSGVQTAIQAGITEIAQAQPYSPEISLVYVTQNQDNTFQMSTRDSVGAQPGLLMIEVPLSQWLDQVVDRLLNQPDWELQINTIIKQAISVIRMLQIPVTEKHLIEENHPNSVQNWPIRNGFDRMVALYEGISVLGALFQEVNPDMDIEYFLDYINETRAKKIRETFQLLIENNVEELIQRLHRNKIVRGHGDTKIENLVVMLDDKNNEHLIAVDPLRFVDGDTQELRPWHVRDMTWEPALLLATTAIRVARTHGVSEGLKFLIGGNTLLTEDIDQSDRLALVIYTLYALYVQADTYLRIAISYLRAKDYEATFLIFKDVNLILQMGEGYATFVESNTNEQ